MHVCLVLTSNRSDDLVSHVSDVFNGERLEVILLEEIIGAEAKQLKGDTNVAMVVKPVQHVHTCTKGEERCNTCKVRFFSWQNLDLLSDVITSRLADFCGMTLLWIDLLSPVRVKGLQLFKHLYLRHSRLTVAVYVFNDLQSHSSSITGNTQYNKYFFIYQMKEKE